MPFKEFKCGSCGKIIEKIVSADTVSVKCQCGGECKINYSGKCYIVKKGGGCDGNCGGCKGCKS